jgi:hypothetical protein
MSHIQALAHEILVHLVIDIGSLTFTAAAASSVAVTGRQTIMATAASIVGRKVVSALVALLRSRWLR